MKGEIRSHTGLRGVAALMVVAYHQQFTAGYKLPIETATELFRRSYLMVDLFFILSGFIISYVYNAEERMGSRAVLSFGRARFARIYPLHVFALLSLTIFTLGVSTLLVISGHRPQQIGSFGDWFRELILLNAWIPARNEWNVPSWSISAEAFAYLLFPLFAAAYAARARLTQLAVLAAAASFYLLAGNSLDITVGLAPLRCIAGFSLGMLLFYHRERIEHLPALSVLQLVAFVWIVVALVYPVRDSLIIPPFFAIVALTWRDRGIVAELLAAKPLHWLGQVSYSVYLMHVPVGAAIWFIWVRIQPKLGLGEVASRSLLLCIVFTAVLTVSSLTYRFVERPCQEALRRRPVRARDALAAAP